MLSIVRLAAAIDVLLIVLEASFPGTRWLLPLGGSHIAQLGIVLGLAFLLIECADAGYAALNRWRAKTDSTPALHQSSRPDTESSSKS